MALRKCACIDTLYTELDWLDRFQAAKNDGCAVIYIVPSIAQLIPEEIAKYSGETVPAVIPLPEAGGGYGITQLKSAVERAVGADIIFKEQ